MVFPRFLISNVDGEGKQEIQGYPFLFGGSKNGHLPSKKRGGHTATSAILTINAPLILKMRGPTLF
jgi:hypothetical protein